jgi:hypothetical protein
MIFIIFYVTKPVIDFVSIKSNEMLNLIKKEVINGFEF